MGSIGEINLDNEYEDILDTGIDISYNSFLRMAYSLYDTGIIDL